MKKFKDHVMLAVTAALLIAINANAQTTYWRTIGNTNAQLPNPASSSFAGTRDSTDYVLKACNVECARFGCDGNVTFSGTVNADNIEAGDLAVDGHVITDHDTTAASPGRCEIHADFSNLSLIKATGNLNALPVIDVKTSMTGNVNVVGLNAYAFPVKGYGYGISGQGGRRGVSGTAVSSNYSGSTYGVYGTSSGNGGARYGVYGAATTGSSLYGVFGTAPSGIANSYAGYFSGNLQYTGQLIGPSDKKLKRTIINLTGVSDRMSMLQPVSFYFKNDEYPSMNFPSSLQFGLIADDVQKLFPELVTENYHPDVADGDVDAGRGGVNYKGVNYIGFIPLLIESFKEQKQVTDALKNQNNELTERINMLEARLEATAGNKTVTETSRAMLGQNDPNPFNQTTVIRYSLPAGVQNAQLKIYSTAGNEVMSDSLSKAGASITIHANTFTPGIYVYVLIVDGKTIDSRQMIITR